MLFSKMLGLILNHYKKYVFQFGFLNFQLDNTVYHLLD